MASVLDPVWLGWCPSVIKSLGLLGIPFVLASLWGAKLVAKGESSAKGCLNLFKNTPATSVLPVVTDWHLTVRRPWKVMTPAFGQLDFLLA